jgi:hypothetical protein
MKSKDKYLKIYPDDRVIDLYTRKFENLSDCVEIFDVESYNASQYSTALRWNLHFVFERKALQNILVFKCIGYTLRSNTIEIPGEIVYETYRASHDIVFESTRGTRRAHKLLRKLESGAINFSIYNRNVKKDNDKNYYHKLFMYKELQDFNAETREFSYKLAHNQLSDSLVPIMIDGVCYYVQSMEIASKLGFVEDYNSALFCENKYIGSFPKKSYEKFAKLIIPSGNEVKFGMKSPTFLITEGKRFTFGVEIETYNGLIPRYLRKDLNIDCQYDGSIRDQNGQKDRGGEYTTGVLTGDAGFIHLYKIVDELSKRCEINNTCSIHVHIGNIPYSKEFIVLVYKLLLMIEDEVYNMMPPSRRTREHCRPMKPININFKKPIIPFELAIDNYFSEIVNIMSLGKFPSKNINRNLNHPNGRFCGYDRSTPRYWWINFIPMLFNIKGVGNHTMEMRPHSASLNYEKIKNWILITMGIFSYALNHQKDIIERNNITLSEIMAAEYLHKGSYLSSYIEKRKTFFAQYKDSAEEAEYAKINNLNDEQSSMKGIILS